MSPHKRASVEGFPPGPGASRTGWERSRFILLADISIQIPPTFSKLRDTEEVVEGERTQERVAVLALPHGDEAIRAELTPLTQDGEPTTQVRVETRRGSNKKGNPKHIWSAAVLDEAVCLLAHGIGKRNVCRRRLVAKCFPFRRLCRLTGPSDRARRWRPCWRLCFRRAAT